MAQLSFSYHHVGLLSGLPFDYLQNSENLLPFIEAFPTAEAISKQAVRKSSVFGHRAVLIERIREQYKSIAATPQVLQNIETLSKQNAVTITTGHQICLATGPLFFIYKIASAVALAKRMNALDDGQHYVPVFWMATEDHDLEEVNHVYLQGNKWTWENRQTGAVGRMNMQGAEALLDALALIPADESKRAKVLDLLKEYVAQPRWSDATRFLVNALFGEHGVVVVDADDAALKACFKDVLHAELLGANTKQVIESSTEKLQQLGYSGQVQAREINLFYLKDGLRERIELRGDEWGVNKTSLTFTQPQLEQELEEHPERFSPNVVMRPLYQEVILPNVAYIGGPGEVNYWLQLKGVFDQYGVMFPLVVLRNNALLLSAPMVQRVQKTGFTLPQLLGDAEVLHRQIIGKDAGDLLAEERLMLAQLFAQIAGKLTTVDATLQGATMAEAKKADAALDNLSKKAIRALKTKEETRLRQLDRVLQELKPQGSTQDRVANLFEFLLQWSGEEVVDALVETFDPFNNQYTVIAEVPLSA